MKDVECKDCNVHFRLPEGDCPNCPYEYDPNWQTKWNKKKPKKESLEAWL